MSPKWDPTQPGFVGNDNIYGIGIRVGYYTQAVSIWVANFYARHEAPYLHTLTILFLVALFVGLCELCKNPMDTYAVEPFMLTSIAYYTLAVGLWDPSPPYLLPWEVEFRKQFTVKIIWLAFQGFDAWYWWVGVWKMKPSHGPLGTVIFYPYVGNTPLFGPEQWISIAAKVINVLISLILLFSVTRLCCYTVQQRRFDRLLSDERLKHLTSRWVEAEVGRSTGKSKSGEREKQDIAPAPTATVDEKKVESMTATEPPAENAISSGFRQESHLDHSSTDSQPESECLPPYRSPTRTGTGLLKLALWRSSSRRDVDLSLPPPDYVLYEPSFEGISAAIQLLKATAECSEKRPAFWGANVAKAWLYLPRWCLEVLLYFCTQIVRPYRPGVLLAVASHAYNIRFGRRLSYPKILRLTLNHPAYRTASSKDAILASRILLSTEKLIKPPRAWYFGVGYMTLGACTVLVISTELTIQWNGIKDVQDLSSVGQLIPFTLGAGGLLKVIYSAVTERDVKEWCYFGHCANLGERNKWKEAAEEFLKYQQATSEGRSGTSIQPEQRHKSVAEKVLTGGLPRTGRLRKLRGIM